MKVEKFQHTLVEEFTFEGDDATYWRLGEDCWYQWVEGCLESLYDTNELEEAYQEYISKFKVK